MTDRVVFVRAWAIGLMLMVGGCVSRGPAKWDVVDLEAVYTLRGGAGEVTVVVGGDGGMVSFGPRFDRTLRVSSWVRQGEALLTGPGLVDEFGLRGEGVLGYEESGAGGHFLKIGVGILERTDERPYFFSRRYPVVDRGTQRMWSAGPERVEAQWISPPLGEYRVEVLKRLWLEERRLVLETEVINRSRRTISFETYNHHFLAPGGERAGPRISLRTDFPLQPEKDHPFLELDAREIRLRQELPDNKSAYIASPGVIPAELNRVLVRLDGKDWMELGGDFDASGFEFFALDTAVCPEVFLQRELRPGERTRWRRTWTLPEAEILSEEPIPDPLSFRLPKTDITINQL